MKVQLLIAIIFSATLNVASGQGPAVSGQSSTTGCTISSGNCATSGASNYITRSLSYDTATGKFSGSIVTNLCSNDRWGLDIFGVSLGAGPHSASCVSQTFPAPAYSGAGPYAAPLRGGVGYSISGGVYIYGPFEAGFTLGQACDNGLGTCPPAIDISACTAKLEAECGVTHVKKSMLMDSCGGHANPYHYHFDLACDYNVTAAGHSTLVGVALDGRGIYGKFESTGAVPTDLDACGGHYGPVPAYSLGGVSYPAALSVYHYHTQTAAPFTVGCFGPVTSMAQCKALYPSTCGTGYIDVVGLTGCKKNYDTDCPCFKQGVDTYNQLSMADCATTTASAVTSTAQGGEVSTIQTTVKTSTQTGTATIQTIRVSTQNGGAVTTVITGAAATQASTAPTQTGSAGALGNDASEILSRWMPLLSVGAVILNTMA